MKTLAFIHFPNAHFAHRLDLVPLTILMLLFAAALIAFIHAINPEEK